MQIPKAIKLLRHQHTYIFLLQLFALESLGPFKPHLGSMPISNLSVSSAFPNVDSYDQTQLYLPRHIFKSIADLPITLQVLHQPCTNISRNVDSTGQHADMSVCQLKRSKTKQSTGFRDRTSSAWPATVLRNLLQIIDSFLLLKVDSVNLRNF